MKHSDVVDMWQACEKLAAELHFKIDTGHDQLRVSGPEYTIPFQDFDTVEGLHGFLLGASMMRDFEAVKKYDHRTEAQVVHEYMDADQQQVAGLDAINYVLDALTRIKEGATPPE